MPSILRAAPVCCFLAALVMSAPAVAHVGLDSPEPGAQLTVGQTVVIAWTDLVLHDPEGFDLDLLLSEDGEPIPIEHGLAIETHSYDWVVFDMPCAGCFLKVTQLNTINDDYTDMIPISIVRASPDSSGSGMSSAGGAASSDDSSSGGVSSAGGAPDAGTVSGSGQMPAAGGSAQASSEMSSVSSIGSGGPTATASGSMTMSTTASGPLESSDSTTSGPSAQSNDGGGGCSVAANVGAFGSLPLVPPFVSFGLCAALAVLRRLKQRVQVRAISGHAQT